MSNPTWIAVAALIISVLGGAFNLGVVYADLQKTKADVQEVKTDLQALGVQQVSTDQRIERIDANVQFLTEMAREERRRR